MVLIVTDPHGAGLDSTQAYHLYCCLDGMVTREVFDALHPRLPADQVKFYDAQMAFQSPTLAMTLRGVCVDERALAEALKLREREEREAVQKLAANPLIAEVWDQLEQRSGKCQNEKPHRWNNSVIVWRQHCKELEKAGQTVPSTPPSDASAKCVKCGCARLVPKPINPHSTQQMAHLLYDLLGMKKRYSRKTGEATTDDDALEALAKKYPEHACLIDAILEAREARKQVSVLRSRRDADGRWRASFNVGAAETDRMSSSKSPYRTGSNLQNIAERSRNIFVADPGLILFYADGEQAESRLVAHDAECEQDIEDHESGDTHTGLAKTLFPALPWGTDTDKAIAKTILPWDPEHDYRHVAKIVRHGTNIGMTHVGIARELRQDQRTARALREGYFERYPENLRRQQEIRREVRDTGALANVFGRRRLFLGRPWDEDTMKEALAQSQQSGIAWILNIAMWRIWYEMDGRLNIGKAPRPSDPNRVWLLGQIHDAVLGLVRPGDDATLQRVKEIIETPTLVRGRLCRIPAEILLGTAWRKDMMKPWHSPHS